jgi:esterase/lipase superfamily enzyme
MKRVYVKWFSKVLKREMELVTFGHQGPNILVFPSSKGRFFDWENFGMVKALWSMIDAGTVQFTCVDSADRESFYNDAVQPAERIMMAARYDEYVAKEVVPFMQSVNPPYLGSTGNSFGGYHAMCFGLRHPDLIHKIISLSGLFDIKSFFDNYYDQQVYFHNPVDFMYHMNDENLLELFRQQSINMATSPNDPYTDTHHRMAFLFSRKNIPYTLDIPADGFHDWGWWQYQIQRYLP